MTVKSYKRINLIFAGVLAITIALAMFTESFFVALLSLGLYMVLISLLKTRVSGVLADERQIKVSEKAAQTSFVVLMPILLLTSFALMAGSGSEQFYYLKALGIVLSYITSLSISIYVITYWYFNKKTGGN